VYFIDPFLREGALFPFIIVVAIILMKTFIKFLSTGDYARQHTKKLNSFSSPLAVYYSVLI